MSLRELMLHDLARALAVIREGHEVVPAWRILTPEGDFLILTRFDPDKPDQRERMLALVPRFMAWKMATAFVLTADTWLGPERAFALLAAGSFDPPRRPFGCVVPAILGLVRLLGLPLGDARLNADRRKALRGNAQRQ